MKHSKGLFSLISILLILLSACSMNNQTSTSVNAELTISAAVSLMEPLEKIKKKFEEEYPNIRIRYNFGGSGSLQQQISQGAPVDLFFSAAEDKFMKLVEEDLIIKDSSSSFLQNELVLIVPIDNSNQISRFQDLIHNSVDYISIGTPETVPAGKYAKEVLTSLEIWDEVEDKMVYGKDVRQVLSYVETGNVTAGLVYRTDALLSDKVTILEIASRKDHSPIVYPVGIISGTNQVEAATKFIHYLQEPNTLEVFKNYGFIIE